MTRTTDHPLRQSLHEEIHARPYAVLNAPERASHLALVGQRGHDEIGHLTQLCGRFAVAPPPSDATHFTADYGAFRLKWEQHTEFFTYTFFVAGSKGDPFGVPAIQHVPEDWLAAFEAQILVAVDVAFETADAAERTTEEMSAYFAGHKVVGSGVAGGGARVWTDFQLHAGGATRFLIKDSGLTPGQGGRLVQRLLEIETYRMMALLALPVAREVGARLADMEAELALAAEAAKTVEGAGEERALLGRLTDLSAEVEAISSRRRCARARASTNARKRSPSASHGPPGCCAHGLT